MNFYPFKKPFSKVLPSDLSALKEVREGWYVEYKQEMISPKKIAKSICSFANQFGGLLFFGIAESMNQSAGEFIGIPNAEVNNACNAIRDAATKLIQPSVVFEINQLQGPCCEIGLVDDRITYNFFRTFE
ncbi:MAG: ATP-binding protein [Myxococcales bacterium]|nr:ATP-binding protein [Myxococcales bacterium]